ncbi:MAG: dihydropteroate synthase [Myxococcota bacterium]
MDRGSRSGRGRGQGERCAVWGVLNVTPDSFSDGGEFEGDSAVARGLAMVREGADVIDVGGESTRPKGPAYGDGYDAVDGSEERRRTEPVVRALVAAGVQVSIDTTKGSVARAALEAGARIVNDVSGGNDPELLAACAEHGAELCLMHNRQRGEVVGQQAHYTDVVHEVCEELSARVERAVDAGVARDVIWLDPGVGFAKGALDSARVIANLGPLLDLGHRVLVGHSRKSFISALTAEAPPKQRLGGTAAALAVAVMQGASAVRVHDVAMMVQATRLTEQLAQLREASV